MIRIRDMIRFRVKVGLVLGVGTGLVGSGLRPIVSVNVCVRAILHKIFLTL